jgi:predicted transcriptional regulator
MKTTIELADSLLTEVKDLAMRDETTPRALAEEGLRHVVAKRQRRPDFQLRRASFRGRGLQPGLREGDRTTLLELVYQGRDG